MKKISEIAEITQGYHVRRSINRFAGKEACLLRLIDISRIDGHLLEEIDIQNCGISDLDIKEKYLVKNGDILLASRSVLGKGFKAVYVDIDEQKNFLFNDENTNVPIYAGLSLFIIRVKDGHYLPEYIALYLNSPEGQKQLTKISEGVTVPAISIKKLIEKVSIPQISKNQQKTIINLARTVLKQKRKLQEKIFLQDQIIKALPNLIK